MTPDEAALLTAHPVRVVDTMWPSRPARTLRSFYALAERATDAGDCRRVVRRCLTEAEGLCEIAESALRKDWLER